MPDLDSACLKTLITTFCWTILMDLIFSFFGFKVTMRVGCGVTTIGLLMLICLDNAWKYNFLTGKELEHLTNPQIKGDSIYDISVSGTNIAVACGSAGVVVLDIEI